MSQQVEYSDGIATCVSPACPLVVQANFGRYTYGGSGVVRLDALHQQRHSSSTGLMGAYSVVLSTILTQSGHHGNLPGVMVAKSPVIQEALWCGPESPIVQDIVSIAAAAAAAAAEKAESASSNPLAQHLEALSRANAAEDLDAADDGEGGGPAPLVAHTMAATAVAATTAGPRPGGATAHHSADVCGTTKEPWVVRRDTITPGAPSNFPPPLAFPLVGFPGTLFYGRLPDHAGTGDDVPATILQTLVS